MDDWDRWWGVWDPNIRARVATFCCVSVKINPHDFMESRNTGGGLVSVCLLTVFSSRMENAGKCCVRHPSPWRLERSWPGVGGYGVNQREGTSETTKSLEGLNTMSSSLMT